ncbi:uncharacterized protein TNCV_1220071 [Trichonephila clavipes]|nr:uncharacterized protein TNCV_1220071 [Trichonephila clavipes]
MRFFKFQEVFFLKLQQKLSEITQKLWFSNILIELEIKKSESTKECFFPGIEVGITFQDGDRFNSCQVIYSQFGLAIHQNDHQARRRFIEWAQNEMAVVPDFHKRILFSDEAHFWLNGYVNKQNCRIWSATIDLLKDTLGDRLISRFGPVNWPPRSCDLTPLDYFL